MSVGDAVAMLMRLSGGSSAAGISRGNVSSVVVCAAYVEYIGIKVGKGHKEVTGVSSTVLADPSVYLFLRFA